ncbi:hypothetical protein L1987_08042 [Smallanthus sonchifolius]|uniref:Uncharacterized protein n=1 Tax=Smallanthus sonchifolius TaxID=185202 RepID=A0ACB9JJ45_9ASTR|nr:hypothetical protein L1987_08042 [Smallanthus sonchifolius]
MSLARNHDVYLFVSWPLLIIQLSSSKHKNPRLHHRRFAISGVSNLQEIQQVRWFTIHAFKFSRASIIDSDSLSNFTILIQAFTIHGQQF